jgi:hypothetical protein
MVTESFLNKKIKNKSTLMQIYEQLARDDTKSKNGWWGTVGLVV